MRENVRKMYQKHKRKLMMEHNAEEEIYQRRKKCWLSYGRALLTFGILGLLTVVLFTVARSDFSSKNVEHHERILVIDNHQKPFAESVGSVSSSLSDQSSAKVAKRSVDLQTNANRNENSIDTPKNLDNKREQAPQSLNEVDSVERNQELKQFRPEPGTSSYRPHRHPNGDVYYFKGYKCVPIRKPSNQLELLRARQRSSGML